MTMYLRRKNKKLKQILAETNSDLLVNLANRQREFRSLILAVSENPKETKNLLEYIDLSFALHAAETLQQEIARS